MTFFLKTVLQDKALFLFIAFFILRLYPPKSWRHTYVSCMSFIFKVVLTLSYYKIIDSLYDLFVSLISLMNTLKELFNSLAILMPLTL